MNTDPVADLRHDHRRIRGLLDVLDEPLEASACAAEERRVRAVDLVLAESRHQADEDEVIWPMVRAVVVDGDRLADRALADNRTAGELLRIVETSEAGGPEFEEALAALIPALRRRLDFEEQEVWPRLDAALTADPPAGSTCPPAAAPSRTGSSTGRAAPDR